MTNEQLAAYLEQLTMNLGKLLQDAQNQLNEDGVTHTTEYRTLATPLYMEYINETIYGRNVDTENIEAMQPLFWCVENLQQTILTLDPKRIIDNDNH